MLWLGLLLTSNPQTRAGRAQEQIAFTIDRGPGEDADAITSDLFVCDLQGKHVRKVASKITEWLEHGGDTEPNANGDDFIWSPDGKWIAFHRFSHAMERTYLIASSGGKERILTPAGYSDTPERWIDAQHLAISRGTRAIGDLRVVILDTTTGQIVKEKYWPDDYSPNHRFKLLDKDRNGWTDLDMVDRATGLRTTLAKQEEAGFMDVWSPDSKWICVNWGLDDRPVVVNTSTGKRYLDRGNSLLGDIFWSPDSRYVTWTSHDLNDPDQGITLLDTRNFSTKRVSQEDYEIVGWTRDNRRLIATRVLADSKEVVALPISGRKPSLIIRRKDLGDVRLSGYVRYARDNGGE